MQIIKLNKITRTYVKAQPHYTFVFGDNELRKGMGGQAYEMRGEPNTIGVRTKKLPNKNPEAYWTDDNYLSNCRMIDEDINRIRKVLEAGGSVVFPAAGIGTGLSEMAKYCPKTFRYLNDQLKALELGFNT